MFESLVWSDGLVATSFFYLFFYFNMLNVEVNLVVKLRETHLTLVVELLQVFPRFKWSDYT